MSRTSWREAICRLPPLWCIVLAIAVILGAGLAASGFRLSWSGIAAPLAAAGGLALVSRFYTAVRPDRKLAAAADGLALLVAFTALATPLSYVAASANLPLIDATLHNFDGAIGFDWRALLAYESAHPLLARLLALAYETLLPQIAIAIIALSFTGRIMALQRMIAAMMVSGLIAIALSVLLPAAGTYGFLHVAQADYATVHPSIGFVADFAAVRNGSLRILSVDILQGIIAFPSYHSCLGALLGWAFWRVPLLRWPAVAVEGALIVATPVHGGHYLADVFAGGLLAAGSLLLAVRFFGGSAVPHPAVSRASPIAAPAEPPVAIAI